MTGEKETRYSLYKQAAVLKTLGFSGSWTVIRDFKKKIWQFRESFCRSELVIDPPAPTLPNPSGDDRK